MSATHGLASTYRSTRYACRCEPCCRANTERAARERAARTERMNADPSAATHGIWATYTNWGCRCEACTAANSEACARQYIARRRGRAS